MKAELSCFVEAMEIYRAFTRPIIYDSAIAVLKFFNIQNFRNVYYRGESEIVRLPGSDFGGLASDQLYVDGSMREKIYVDAEVVRSPFNSGAHNARRMRTEKIFWGDKLLNAYMFPEFEGRGVNVRIMFHCTSRRSAQNIVDRMSTLRKQMVSELCFDGIGHLPINHGIIALYKELFDLGVKNKIYRDDAEFVDYLTANRCHALTMMSNLAGNHKTLAFPLKLNDLMVQFDDPEILLAQKGEVFGQYEVSFSYNFFLNNFMGWNMVYPLNVHQDEISEGWIVKANKQFQRATPYLYSANPEYVMGVSFVSNYRQTQSPFFVRLPAHDSWIKEQLEDLYLAVQVRLVVEDIPGEQLLCNIFDIPKFDWNEKAKAYILRRYEKAFLRHDTPFLFELYSDDLQVLPSQMRLTPSGDVYINRPPTLSRTQHLTISIDYDVKNYSDDFWDDLNQHPDDADLLPGLFPELDYKDDWKEGLPSTILEDTTVFNRHEMIFGLIALREE